MKKPPIRCLWVWPALLIFLSVHFPAQAQQPMGHEDDFAEHPPLKPPPRNDGAQPYERVARESDLPWGLPEEILQQLRERLEDYRYFALRFTCDEAVVLARYKRGEAVKEKDRRVAYFLLRGAGDGRFVEERRKLRNDGLIRVGSEASYRDDTRFPPPYQWGFMFSEENEPYFSFRHLEERLEGFTFVHEIQFRGAIRYTEGKDIREWEGTILMDAATGTVVSVVAEPTNQRMRIREVYRRFVQALHISIFGLINFHSRPRPIGFRFEVDFDHRHEGVTFPTRIRYLTFQADLSEITPMRASTRSYEKYRFTRVDTEEQLAASPGVPDVEPAP